MKSYQIIIGRDGTCDEDSDLEAQLWLQFPSRNCIHSPKPSLVHGWEASCSPVKRKNPNPKRWRQESQKSFHTASKWHSNIVSRCLVSLAASFEDRSSRQRAAPASPGTAKQNDKWCYHMFFFMSVVLSIEEWQVFSCHGNLTVLL